MKKTLIEELKESVNQFVEETIKDAPNKELIRKPLRRCLLKYQLLKYKVAWADNFDDVEKLLNESAQFLGQRIEHIQNFLAKYARLKKSLINLEIDHSKQSFPTTISTQNDKFAHIFNELANLDNDVSKTFAELEFFKIDLPSMVLETAVKKRYEQFQKLREQQKQKQKIYRFLWAVVIAGFAISFLASNVLKLFLTSWWLILIVGSILSFVIAIIKEYWISPWIRSKRLELQRKLLIACLGDFIGAEIALVLYAPESMFNELVLSYTDSTK